jgi:UDP-N-acetylglucosamine 2-epimerase (non-hydrolysing)
LKILLVFGTRPEAIKMASVIYELREKGMEFKVCVTAQHREMLDQVLDFFDIIPDYDLDLMKTDQNLNKLSALILEKLDRVLESERPDMVLVQGDTTSAFLAALAAFNRGVKIGHIEAGLRTGNLRSPFPEEANRQLISRIADLHFTPTKSALKHLKLELINPNQIFLTGNTVLDSLEIGKEILGDGYMNSQIKEFKDFLKSGHKLVLVTGHRRENFGKGLEEVCEAILQIAKLDRTQVIFPVHMNPLVKEAVNRVLRKHSNILLCKPVNYPTFIWLMSQCDLIISDSGGIQEEAPSFKKHVIVTRETTERPEGIEKGFSVLAGTSKIKIFEEAERVLKGKKQYPKADNPYGDGKAAQKIVKILQEFK